MAAKHEDFVIRACTVLTDCVTNRQTDGQTDTSTTDKTCKALHAVAGKKTAQNTKQNPDAIIKIIMMINYNKKTETDAHWFFE